MCSPRRVHQAGRSRAMSIATMSYGVRARERMPFAWDTVTWD